MNNKLIAIAVAGVLAAPMAAQAGDVSVSGFVAVDWAVADDSWETANGGSGTNDVEGQFSVPQVEVDIAGSGVRVDINDNGAGLVVEQANLSTDLSGWTLTAGVFNSGLTADAQDRADMKFDSHSLVYDLYDNAGNGGLTYVAGLAVSGMAGPANVMVAYVNDPTITPSATQDAGNAVVVAASGSVMDGLNVGVSMVSADATDLTDLTVDYTMDALTVGLDYATSDIQDAYSLTAGYDLGNGVSVGARIDNAEDTTGGATDGDTIDTVTLRVDYALSDNVTVALENLSRTDEDATGTPSVDTSFTTVSFVSTF
jgi:hypothetical protein